MDTSLQNISFTSFLDRFKNDLKLVFSERNKDASKLCTRGYNEEEYKQIMKSIPLSVAIPTAYGGRGLKVKECLSVLEAASYQSLPLTLMFGINIALFLEPFAKYGQDYPKAEVYRRFLQDRQMGGLMISEPLHGSDALNMATSHELIDDKQHIKGMKHWQGLSGDADFWLVAARQKTSSGSLVRDISLFMTDNHKAEQHIPLIERYNNNGLYPISYGKNKIDIQVPDNQRLIPETTGIKMLMDVLHRSRMQFPGMGMGFFRRVVEETSKYCNERLVRGKSLLQFDQVKFQLAQLQSSFTICSAMCYRSAKMSGIDQDLALMSVEANTIKSRITDLMQHAAQTMTQLFGSSGYKISNRGSRGIMDSRPFQIFEGPNEMLYSQISEAVTKEMRKMKLSLIDYLKQSTLTSSIADHFSCILNGVEVNRSMIQRKHVVIGEVVSRIISAAYINELSETKFNKELLDSAIDGIKKEVSGLINRYQNAGGFFPVSNFNDNNNWSISL